VENESSITPRYEQNLLEIGTAPPNYVRCKALPRIDTDDLPEEDWQKYVEKIKSLND